MITYKQGNLITAFKEGEVNAIAHQTNCSYGLGAGFAKLIANEFPEVKKMDESIRTVCKNYPQHLIGTPVFTYLQGKIIANLYSQFYVGSPSNEHFDTFDQRCYWLRAALNKAKMINPSAKWGIPLLASHRGACQKRRIGLTDLEYFQKYIEPLIPREMDITVYYL